MKLIITAAVLGVTLSLNVGAKPNCSLKTLKGTYLYNTMGENLGVPYSEAGQETYDGKGNVLNDYTASDGTSATVTGTYTMETNCKARVSYSSGDEVTLYVSPLGETFSYIYNNTGEGNSKSGMEIRTSKDGKI